MDASLEKVQNSFEVGVRKLWPGGCKKGISMSQVNRNTLTSKIFGLSFCDISDRKTDTVSYLVKDICAHILANHTHCEDTFRLSSATCSTSELRQAFEQYVSSVENYSVCSDTSPSSHVAAEVLKQFLRELSPYLIPEDILKISADNQFVSDGTFAANIRLCMEKWPAAHRCTLQYLLSFLQLILRDVENRVSLSGLAVAFGSNVFAISGGAKGCNLQALANLTFERLLQTTDIICGTFKDEQGYLSMSTPSSVPIRPSRLAPPIPKQARPLPPPPIPIHASEKLIIHTVTSSPNVPQRSTSLQRNSANGDVSQCKKDSDSTENEVVENSSASNHLIVDETIRHVVCKHLFTAQPHQISCFDDVLSRISSSSDDDDESVTVMSLSAEKRRRSFDGCSFQEGIAGGDYIDVYSSAPKKTVHVLTTVSLTNPQSSFTTSEQVASSLPRKSPESSALTHVTTATTTVTTPDSGCLTMEEEASQQMPENCDRSTHVFIPKLNLQEALDDDAISDVTEIVPPLDLSEVTQFDEVINPLPKETKITSAKSKKHKRKHHKSSHSQNKPLTQTHSEPINIPVQHTSSLHVTDDVSREHSPKDGSSRWRDAWSTDEETVPMHVAMENAVRHEIRYSPHLSEGNIEIAPSSLENHFPRHHAHHHSHHHHRHHHHHHENHLNRPKMQSNSLHESRGNLDEMFSSLQDVLDSLDLNRKENGRPEDITLMTRGQIRMEKMAMQRELLKHESRHGRPSTKEEKELMGSIYERYRMLKRLMVDTLSPPFKTAIHRRFDDIEQDFDINLIQQSDEFAVTQVVTLAPPDGKKKHHPTHLHFESNDHVAANIGIYELRKQEKEAKSRRKRLRRKLRDFEREIEQQYGRSINQGDRISMATEYSEYRDLKAKLRLLEALIEKHNSQNRKV